MEKKVEKCRHICGVIFNSVMAWEGIRRLLGNFVEIFHAKNVDAQREGEASLAMQMYGK